MVRKGENGIEAMVGVAGGKQKIMGKAACPVGGHATACLPGWFGIAASAGGERAARGNHARSTTAGATAAGNDGGVARAKNSSSRKVKAKGVVPGLVKDRF